MKGLNIKGLCKQIRESKHKLIWSLNEGVHTITNRHWLINLSALPYEVKIELLKTFEGIEIQEGQMINSYHDIGLVDKPLNIPKQENETVEFEWTDYYRNCASLGMTRVFRHGETIKYINTSYLQAVSEGLVPTSINSSLGNLLFEEIGYMILPVRVNDGHDILAVLGVK